MGLNTENEDGWRVERLPNRELPYINTWANAVTLEVSLDQEKYNRVIYSLLDYVSDLGGLFGAISPVFLSLATILNSDSIF